MQCNLAIDTKYTTVTLLGDTRAVRTWDPQLRNCRNCSYINQGQVTSCMYVLLLVFKNQQSKQEP